MANNQTNGRNSGGPDREQRKLDWKRVATFTDESTGLVVYVTRSDAFRPGYSFEIGRSTTQGEKLARFCRVRTDAHNDKVFVTDRLDSILAELGGRIIAFVEEEAQKDLDDHLERSRQRADRDAQRNKGQVPAGTHAKGKGGKKSLATSGSPGTNSVSGQNDATTKSAVGQKTDEAP